MGRVLNFSRGRRQPLVFLSLLLNILLLGGSVLWWSGFGSSGPASIVLHGGGGAAARRSRTAPNGGSGGGVCQRPQLDEAKLEEWGCKVFHKACFDQGGMVLHSGEKTPDNPAFTPDPLFKAAHYPSYVLPGYEEPMGTPHYTPPCWDVPIRGPTPLDPRDIWQPREFTACTVPIVWWLSYFSVFADLFLNSVAPLDLMAAAGAFDRNVTLAPVTLGLDLPDWYRPLLEPYSRHPPVSLAALSSREHLHDGQPRCFERAVMCNLVGLYMSGGTAQHSWTELKPKTTGQRIMRFHRHKHPDAFLVHNKLAEQENGTVFRVAFMQRARLRSIRNLEQAVQECKLWVPPADTPFKSVDCVVLPDGTADNFAGVVAQMQNVHVFVNTHGSQNTYSYVMKDMTALVEIIPWNFHGNGCTWIDQYYADWYNMDRSVHSAYFRLVADKRHTFPGPYQEAGKGSSVAWGRDQDVTLDFPTLAKVLERVARGQLECSAANQEERTLFMTDPDICPAAEEHRKKVRQSHKEREANEVNGEAQEANGEAQEANGEAQEQSRRRLQQLPSDLPFQPCLHC